MLWIGKLNIQNLLVKCSRINISKFVCVCKHWKADFKIHMKIKQLKRALDILKMKVSWFVLQILKLL